MNYLYLINLILIILTISIVNASSFNAFNRLKKQKSQRKTLIESFSHKIINHFDINKYLAITNEESNTIFYTIHENI